MSAPSSVFAREIRLGQWAHSLHFGPDFNGKTWTFSDPSGKLTDEGLCVFWSKDLSCCALEITFAKADRHAALVSLVVGTVTYKLGRILSPLFFKCYSSLSLNDVSSLRITETISVADLLQVR